MSYAERMTALNLAHTEAMKMMEHGMHPSHEHILGKADSYVRYLKGQPSADRLMAVAEIAHQANMAVQIVNGEENVSPDWDNASEDQRTSALNGVKALMANANLTPADLHDRWVQHKLDNGWIYGETKDEEKKTHPCIRPYNELPKSQHMKDFVFQFVVLAALRVI